METQRKMIEIWERIFKLPVGPDTDFFVDVDGDSGAAAAIVHWIGIELGVDIPMVEVLDQPTPAELTAVVLQWRGRQAVGSSHERSDGN
jgi:hypothetical protein